MWLDGGSPEGEAERHRLVAEGLVEPEPVEGSISKAAPRTDQKPSTLDDGDGGVGLSLEALFVRDQWLRQSLKARFLISA
jgi:hypothetical protein